VKGFKLGQWFVALEKGAGCEGSGEFGKGTWRGRGAWAPVREDSGGNVCPDDTADDFSCGGWMGANFSSGVDGVMI
jgi:hypothetical protein